MILERMVFPIINNSDSGPEPLWLKVLFIAMLIAVTIWAIRYERTRH